MCQLNLEDTPLLDWLDIGRGSNTCLLYTSTVALRRVETSAGLHDTLIESITRPNVIILPNTSGARNADEAVYAAQLAREALQTNWIKLEVHPDPKYLLPDAMERCV